MKVKFTEEEITGLKQRAELQGKKLNVFLRECALETKPLEIFFDTKKFESHTNEISKTRELLKEIIFTQFEDKILLFEYVKGIEEIIFCMETEEAKIRSEVRRIRKLLEKWEAENHGND